MHNRRVWASIVVFGAVAVAGCGSSKTTAAPSTTEPTTVATTTTTTRATTLPATSRPSAKPSAQPAWVAGLGPGVNVTVPGAHPAADQSTPGGLVLALQSVTNAGKPALGCPLIEPSLQAQCEKASAGATTPGVHLTIKSLGYIAVKGDEALVGVVGTSCDPSQQPVCDTNTDPAAIFESSKPFATLFTAAQAAQNSSGNVYALSPEIKIGGKWYADLPSNEFG